MLLVWASSSPGYSRVYSIRHPALILKSDQRTVNVLAFSTNGTQIALAGDSGEVEIWDVRAARRLRTINGSSEVLTIAFSPDGKQLATSSADSKVNIWQLQSDELPLSIEVSGGPVYSIGYTPDGNRIATGCRDGVIRLYSTGGQLLHAFGGIISGIAVVDSPGGARIAALEPQGLRMWDAETGESVLTRTLQMLPWMSPQMPHMGLTQNPMFVLSPGADFVAAALDPDPGNFPVGIYLLTVWNTVTGKKVIEDGGFGWPLYSFSARRNMIAESSFSGISAIDIKTRKELHRYNVDRPFVRSLSFSPDAKWIASGHDDGAVRIWKVQRSRHVVCCSLAAWARHVRRGCSPGRVRSPLVTGTAADCAHAHGRIYRHYLLAPRQWIQLFEPPRRLRISAAAHAGICRDLFPRAGRCSIDRMIGMEF
jgi:WD40 repeat protein